MKHSPSCLAQRAFQSEGISTNHDLARLSLERLIEIGVIRGHARDILDALQRIPAPEAPQTQPRGSTVVSGTVSDQRRESVRASSMHGEPSVSLGSGEHVPQKALRQKRQDPTTFEKYMAVFKEFDETQTGKKS